MASLILGTIGTTLLGPVGGFIGSTVGGLIDRVLFAPDKDDIAGPQTEDVYGSTADVGTPIPIVYGTSRVGGVVIHAGKIVENIQELEASMDKTTIGYEYRYYTVNVDIMVAGNGPILGIGRIWADGKIVRGWAADYKSDVHANPYQYAGIAETWFFTDLENARIYLPEQTVDDFTPENNPDRFSPGSGAYGKPRYNYMDKYTIPEWADWRPGQTLNSPQNISDSYAESYIEAGIPLYWYDYVRNQYYMHPISRDYQGWLNKPYYDAWGFLRVASMNVWTYPTTPYYQTPWYEYLNTGGSLTQTSFAMTIPFPTGVGWPGFDPSELLIDTSGLDEVQQGALLAHGYNPVAAVGGSVPAWVETYYKGVISDYNFPCGKRFLREIAVTVVGFEDAFPLYPLISGVDLVEETAPAAVIRISGFVDGLGNDRRVLESKGAVGCVYALDHPASYNEIYPLGVEPDDEAAAPYWEEINRVVQAGDCFFMGKGYLTLSHNNSSYPARAKGKIHVAVNGTTYLTTEDYFNSGISVTITNNQIWRLPPGSRDLHVSAGAIGEPINLSTRVTEVRLRIAAYVFRGLIAELQFRTWADYYNLHSALNDWHPLSVFQYHETAGAINFYKGSVTQMSDPEMEEEAGETIPAYRGKAHIVFNGMILRNYGNRIPNLTFEVVRYERDNTNAVITDLITLAGVSTDNYEMPEYVELRYNPLNDTEYFDEGFSYPWYPPLTEFVPGYAIARRTTFAKAIETVMNAFDLTAGELGYKLTFRDRYRAPDHTIDYNEFAAHDADSRETEEPIRFIVRDREVLPRIIEAIYQDVEREYQVNTARYEKWDGPTQQISTVDLAMVLYPFYTKQWVRRKMQDIWQGGRLSLSFRLPPEYIYVSASDIIEVVTDIVIGQEDGQDVFATFRIHVTELRRGADGIIDCTGVLSLYDLYPIDDFNFADVDYEGNYETGYYGDPYVAAAVLWLELPPLSEDDIDFGVYAGAYTNAVIDPATWGGGALQKYAPATVGEQPGIYMGLVNYLSTKGEVTSGVLDFVGSSILDYNSTTLTVKISSGSPALSSVTAEDMLSSFANMAMIGGEILCFSTVTSLGGGSYQLTGPFLRGLKDTHGIEHTAREPFVLLDRTKLISMPAVVDDIGVTNSYVILDYKRQIYASPVTEVITGTRLRPFRPVMLEGARDGSDNMVIDWVRQDRLYTSWEDNSDLGMSEETEEYLVEFYNPEGAVAPAAGVTTPTLLRSVTVSSPTVTYTLAERLADGLVAGDSVLVRVSQVSATVGAGPYAETTIA